jgi:hypothetical protein
MKSIERRFNNIVKKNPYWSSYVCFTEAVKGQHFGNAIVLKWFDKLVDKDDYSRSDKNDILNHIYGLANWKKREKVSRVNFLSSENDTNDAGHMIIL